MWKKKSTANAAKPSEVKVEASLGFECF